ncbi:UNVERIFIED_CONTAM: hypothetical protein Sindi_0463900 [Sesamum indicum]
MERRGEQDVQYKRRLAPDHMGMSSSICIPNLLLFREVFCGCELASFCGNTDDIDDFSSDGPSGLDVIYLGMKPDDELEVIDKITSEDDS